MNSQTPPQSQPSARSQKISAWVGFRDDSWTIWYDSTETYEFAGATMARIISLWQATPEKERPAKVYMSSSEKPEARLLREAGMPMELIRLPGKIDDYAVPNMAAKV